ncbi:hypothetical protein ACLMJK_004757 [Lecanora helva]
MDPSIDQPDGRVERGPQEKKPDVMNDPAFDPSVRDKQSNSEDADTCRICRGEGSPEEPLFYPCKCSGSIKFVHQNCLIEWLSHSQKKYCELCKTPFHFTKLYSPDMPNAVPLPIFFRQAAVHIWKSMVTFSRFLLVTFVWAAWLPWCMRTIWRGLFWLADGTWVNWTEKGFLNGSMAYGFASNHTSQATSSLKNDVLTSKEATASALVAQISNKLPRFIPPAGKLFSFSSGQPWSLVLLKKAYSYLTAGASIPTNSSVTSPANITSHAVPASRSSWLSELRVMRKLTPSTFINNMLIDTLEGQLITLFVVTAFILIFLIREWVVQQQPILNGGNNLQLQAAVAQDAPAPEQAADQRPNHPEGGVIGDAVGEGHQAQGPRARIIARARPRRQIDLRRLSEQGGRPEENAIANTARNGLDEREESENLSPSPQPEGEPSGSAASPVRSQRPKPSRDMIARVAEIRRIVEEHGRKSGSTEPMNVFRDFWDRAGKEPSEVIKTIEQEGRTDDLRWLFSAMVEVNKRLKQFEDERRHTSSDSVEKDNPDSRDGLASIDGELSLNSQSLSSVVAEPLPEQEMNEKSLATLLANAPSPPTDAPISKGSKDVSLEEDSDHLTPSNDGDHWSFIQAGQDSPTSNGKQPVDSPESSEREGVNGTAQPENPIEDNPFHPGYQGEYPGASFDTNGVGNGAINEEPTNVQQTNPLEVIESTDGETRVPPTTEAPGRARRIIERTKDWLWGGVAPLPAPPEQPADDEEHVVNNVAAEAPFIPMNQGQPLPLAANNDAVANQDPDVVAAAAQAGINPNEADAAEEIEDLEGILELIGMQGPMAGLVQNGMFCACLVSLTIFLGVWIPYISGKMFLVLLAHPISLLFRIPVRWATSSADMIIDLFTFLASCAFYWTDVLVSAPIGYLIPPLGRLSRNAALANLAKAYAEDALERLADNLMASGGVLSEPDIPMFSVIAHESLQSIKAGLAWVAHGSFDQIAAVATMVSQSSGLVEFVNALSMSLASQVKILGGFVANQTSAVRSLWPSFSQINPLRINLALPQRSVPIDFELAYWNMKDRALAVAFGYCLFALMGMAYIRISSRMQTVNRNGRVAGGLADGLYQAGGVMKVILIISIEMIIFPLYCGLLLDVALLPLFNNVTFLSRINFTLASPNTSLFVHWFVGTCYMFHFALFVAMCRKILRPGVLYFIRDPDDPTFHPVRDVLERSVSTQLWKISFSALVYGGLVIVCLGGVVWGIAYAFDGVFPIHWASNEPILEFPVDLLFYNFLMPLAVKFFRPSKGLNKMFNWWFRRCARALRLTNFLFGEEREDEEGVNVRRKLATVINKTANTENEGSELAPVSSKIVETHFKQNGRYVRAPGTDQVRIPRGARTFLEVDKENNRLDDQPDSDEGLHGKKNAMFTKVYTPPMFRLRVSAFIFLIWVFAAATGISMTIVPLLFGRLIFRALAPNYLRLNDIYAFSVGIYTLGGLLYCFLNYSRIANYINTTLISQHSPTVTFLLKKAANITLRFLSLLYVYTAFSIFLPALLSICMEFYFIIPAHTYFSTTFTSLEVIQSERHIIHLIQDWTLGVLYLKMAARLILWNTPSRPATALRAIVREGWFKPDVRLATRGFILPATLTIGVALGLPLSLGFLANNTILHNLSSKDELFRACVYRYAYPGSLALVLLVLSMWGLSKAFSGWRKKVRDEVYLIGERLHNFGEGRRRKGGAGMGQGKGKARAVPVAE